MTDDVGMGFRIIKCGVLTTCRGRESECEVIIEVIVEIDGHGYKYLGIIERSDICQEQKKKSVKNE